MISFHIEDISLKVENRPALRRWLSSVIKDEGYEEGEISIIFCSDAYLLRINQQYLGHNDYTDIITFDYVVDRLVSGDVYISAERVKENAAAFNNTFEDELHRVMAHGVLHLCGYKDKLAADKKRMSEQEDRCLAKRPAALV